MSNWIYEISPKGENELDHRVLAFIEKNARCTFKQIYQAFKKHRVDQDSLHYSLMRLRHGGTFHGTEFPTPRRKIIANGDPYDRGKATTWRPE